MTLQIMTEQWQNKCEPHCNTCDRLIKIGERIEVRRTPTHTNYYCEECISKWK